MSNNIPEAAQYIKDFEQLGFGMFVHFGLYSQLNKGEWVYNVHGLNKEEYMKLKDTFNVPTMKEIVALGKAAGCKYINLTTRHHEGFSLYDTCGLNDYDVMHSPTGKDLVKEFADECRKEGIVPFFYHTTLDWYNEDFNKDFDAYLDYLNKSVEILCTNYGKIGGLWFDGNWSKKDADWHEDVMYKVIRKHQPEAMIINNTGLQDRGKLGAEEIDSVTYERGMPTPIDRTGAAKYVAGEMCETLYDHWGAADDINFKSVPQLIEELCECRKVGANFLLNIGPNADGTVTGMQRAIMECIGKWMEKYGTAIYNGRPYMVYDYTRDFLLRDVNDEKIAYLFRFKPGVKGGDAHVTLEFNMDNQVTYKNIDREIEKITWMDNGYAVPFKQEEGNLYANLDGYHYGTHYCVRVAEIKFK